MDTFNSLEESIIVFLQAKHKNRFIADDEKILLSAETDQQAGVVELTEDYACAFKTVPVYADKVEDIAEKLADGSGKLYREMFVCGCQPLATLLSFSTGAPFDAANLQKTIAEMATFSNTFGIPVAGGDAYFNNSKKQNVAANLMTIGLIDMDEQFVSSCHCVGNPVYLVGSPDTGKSIESKAFITRVLYEFMCDLHDDNAIVAVQTIDSGGILGACAALVANGKNGIELNTSNFPLHFPMGELNLTEAMPDKIVLVLREFYGKKLEKACHKWNMRCVQIGIVTDERELKVDKLAVKLPASVLPVFTGEDDVDDETRQDIVSSTTIEAPPAEAPVPKEENYRDIARFLTTRPNLASQKWIFEQFDSTVGVNNLSTNFISDAAVLQIKGSQHALAAMFCQNNSDLAKYPETVNLIISEALHKIICSGGMPRALTGCLNYGKSIDENVLHLINMYIAQFCIKMGIASSGININNVETDVCNLSIGAIGFLNNKNLQMTMSFKKKGDMIYMLGASENTLNSSEYIRSYHNIDDCSPQQFDLEEDIKLMRVVQHLISRKFVSSAHNVSKGGLFMALLESAMVRSFGFDLTVDDEIRKDAFLFGETPSRIIVSVTSTHEANFIDYMMDTKAPFMTLGHVTREEIRIDDNSYGFISDYKKLYGS